MPSLRSKYLAKRRYVPKKKSYSRAGRLNASRVAKIAKRVVYGQRELKQVCNAGSNFTGTAAWQGGGDTLNQIVVGDGPNQRDGLKVKEFSMGLRMALTAPADRPQTMRLIITEAKTEKLTIVDMPTGVNSCIHPQLRVKARILLDRQIHLSPPYGADSTTQTRIHYRRFYFKLGHTLAFEDTTATGLVRGAIQLFLICDNVAGGTDFIDISDVEAITYFKEM